MFDLMVDMPELARLFTPPGFRPAFDVSEDKGAFRIIADLPGVPQESLTINVHEGILVVEGARPSDNAEDGVRCHRSERMTGSFRRTFRLTEDVEIDNISATLKDGILTLILPKRAAVQPRRIAIQS